MSNDAAEPSAPLGGSARYTAGPWLVHGGWGGMVKANDGRYVAQCGRHDIGPEELRANMALVASAPELLSMLKRIIRATDEGCDEQVRKLIELARETVSQAENG